MTAGGPDRINLWRIEPAIGANPLDPKNLVAGYLGHPTQNSGIACFVASTADAGATFFEGDYNNLAVTSEGIFPAWNDGRFNSVQIFTARGTFAP